MGFYHATIRLILRKPSLFPALVGLSWACRPTDWYRRPPFLPVPPSSYLRWRLETAYGDRDAVPPDADAARYLEWARRMRKESRITR